MLATEEDRKAVFPRRKKRCPRGYKFDGENCVFNEKSRHWKSMTPKRRRVQVYQLLNVLEQKGMLGTVFGVASDLKLKLGITEESDALELVAALNRLDRSFSEANWNELRNLLKRLTIHDIEVYENVRRSDFYMATDDQYEKFGEEAVLLIEGGRKKRATNAVYLDAKYRGSDAVLKLLGEYETYDEYLTKFTQVNAIMESIVNICVSAVLHDTSNPYISAPDVLTMGFVTGLHKYHPVGRGLVLVQEKVGNAKTLSSLDEQYLRKALTTLCRGLSKLQQEYNFAHRDFHCENVMYDISKDKVYLIDFGMSCFSIPNTKGSLQLVNSEDFLWDPFEQQSHKPCVNKSADICTLILSLIVVRKLKGNPIQSKWIFDLARMISAKYRKALDDIYDTEIFQKYYKKGYEEIDYDVDVSKYIREWQWEEPIFHYWYIYKLFIIDIKFTPTDLIEYLESRAGFVWKELEENYNVQPNLKF